MVPLNMTYLHCLQHSLFEHLFNLYYVHIIFLVLPACVKSIVFTNLLLINN